ncbi:MAG: hypothetical protein GY950_18330 [bacterium]|nr:hypothetical protein [bacterium]
MVVIKKVMMLIMMLWLLLVSGFANGLHDAAEKGDVTTVKQLLSKSPQLLDARNKVGKTALHLAAHKKQAAAVKMLLAKGADVNIKSTCPQEATPLHFAASGGDIGIVKMLVGKGAKVDAGEKDGETPLAYAAYNGHKEVVAFLLEKGAAVNPSGLSERSSSPLGYAVAQGRIETAKLLVANGADPMEKNDGGFTLLHRAGWRSSGEMYKILISKGARVNAVTDFGWTPVHIACMNGNLEGVLILSEKGAKLNLKDKEGRTPLFLAADRGHADVVSLLLKAGADTAVKEKNYGRAPLHMASIRGYGKIAKMLLSKGADVDAVDDRGKTPIYYAAKYGNKTAAKLLKMKGAKIGKLKKNFGNSPLLSKKLEKGQAITWYLGHSGWAVKTQNHLLVFDYFKGEKGPDQSYLANGHINPGELEGLDVTVLVSHVHGDHYDPSIFEWKKSVKNINYVMGFKPQKAAGNYTYVGPRQKKKIGDMKIITIESNDSGVAFFVLVDGVKIFHSGDHANRKQDFSGPFAKEIDFLAEHNLKPDLFFAPVSGCGFGDLEAVKKGVYYTVKKLSPKVVFPMHAGQNECRYNAFAKEAEDSKIDTPMCCAENRGDRFVYNKGKII